MARTVTEEHKQAMKRGRTISAAIDAYLKAIDKPKRRGRPISLEQLEERLARAVTDAESADGVARLKLIQEASDLRRRIDEAKADGSTDVTDLEAAFVKVAAEYSESQGIDYSSWRGVGVPADVLKKAGIKRTRRG